MWVEENREEEESSDASFRTAEEGLYGEYSSVGRASTTPDIRLQSPSGGIYSPSFPSTTSFRSTVSRIPRIQPVSTESALPSHAQPGHPAPVPVSVTRELPRTSQDPPVTVPPAMPFTAPPPANRGLMDRLKAQRAARMAQPPPAPDRAARDDLQQPPPSPQPPKLPSPPLQPFPTPQPEILLQPFPAADVDCVSHVHLPDDLPLHDVPYGATHLYEPTRQAPDSFAQPAFEAVDHYEDPYFQPSLSHTPPFTHVDHLPNQPFFRRRDSPSHFADADYGGEPDQVPYSPWTLPPHPQQAIHRVPSHLSEQTLLNEAASVSIAAPAPPIIDSPAPPPPPPNTAQVQPLSQPSLSEGGTTGDEPVDPWERRARRERRERQALLDWERARREEERRNQPPPPLLPPSHPLSPVKQVAKAVKPTEERPRSSRSHQSSASPAIPLPEPEPVLAEGWLLLPPTHRPFTDGLLRFSELWAPVYVLLTPATLHLGGLQGEQNEVNLPLIDIVRVVRLSNFNQPTFEPFRIDFASGEYLHVAGTQALDAAFWSLKIDNARSGAYRRPPSIASDVASFVSTTPSRLSLRGGHASSRSSSRTTLHPLPQEPTATPPAFAEISLKNVKDRAWMRDFHQAVPTHAYIEELPANAGSDDWGAIDDELRPTAQAAVPVAVGKTGWPARPPPEESPPPSRPQSELRHSDVDALGFILGKLQEQSNALDAQAVRQESKLQLSREELRRLEERIRERLEREGRKPSRSEQKVLDRVEWLLHLNDVQLRKYAYAMLREGSPSASDSTARAFQKELDLMTTIERELESLRREAKELPTNDRDSVTSSADSLAQRGPTRSLARKPSAISRFSANTSENIPSPTTQMQPQPLPIPRSSPRHSPVSQARQSSQELYYVPENSPVLHEATTSTFQETFMQESPVQEARRGSSTSERRRRLQELFLDVEYLFQQQQAYIASSHDQQERLRRSLGKILNLLQHDSVYRSETLSSLVGHLYDLTSHNLDIPLAPPHFPPAPPHPALSYSETTGTKSSSSSSSAPHMPPKKEMHLLPSDGRMAPRLIPKALAPPLAPPQAAVARAAGPAAAGAGGKGGVRRATNGKRPLFGVDAALQPAHHFHRWRAGPEAAKAAREVTTLAKANEPEPPRTVPAPTDKALQPTPFVEQDERVEKALETLSRPEAKQEKAGAKSGLSGEAAAKKAVAVWELLDAQKRKREAEERAKKQGRGRGRGQRR
ncbi:hypothetical protein RTBOTA2_005545 [Rhodotorula toruloides]|nr:hypothetical protein RTBOTA2_005545 [Rhodotorula toruloides]